MQTASCSHEAISCFSSKCSDSLILSIVTPSGCTFPIVSRVSTSSSNARVNLSVLDLEKKIHAIIRGMTPKRINTERMFGHHKGQFLLVNDILYATGSRPVTGRWWIPPRLPITQLMHSGKDLQVYHSA